jgi:hypothetical protein
MVSGVCSADERAADLGAAVVGEAFFADFFGDFCLVVAGIGRTPAAASLG